MLGSTTVQMASAILLGGAKVITQTIKDLKIWMETHSYNSILDFKGSALKTLEPYEDIPVKNLIAQVKNTCVSEGISKSSSACMYNAIVVNNGVPKVTADLCTGCGLCVEICPECFELVWI